MTDQGNIATRNTTGVRQFCTFRIDKYLYGVDILDVKEINPVVEAVRIHHAPVEITGFINIRGRIYLLLDLRRMLGFPPGEEDPRRRIILFKSRIGEHFGILVDSIEDIVSVSEEQIESRAADKGGRISEEARRKQEYLRKGICKLDDNLLVIIDASLLLPLIDERIKGRGGT